MPRLGTSFDWRRRAIEYDAFVYDWSQPSRFPTIAWDRTHHNMRGDTYKMPSYYGDLRLDVDGTQEGLGQIASPRIGVPSSERQSRGRAVPPTAGTETTSVSAVVAT